MTRAIHIPASTVSNTTEALIEDAKTLIAEHPHLGEVGAIECAFRAWVASLMTMEGGDDTATQMHWANAVWRDLIANGYDLEA